MGTNYYEGGAVAVAQVDTCQVTGYDVDTTYTLTVGDQTVSAIAEGSVDATAQELAALWNASTHPYFATITAEDAADIVTLTADTAGVEFVCTSSVAGGAGTIGAVTSSV
ncbi:unnamed protein product, partial [marine sediment metagenome]